MIKKLFALVTVVFLLAGPSHGQSASDTSGIIMGRIEDTLNDQSMGQATVRLLSMRDTSVILQTVLAQANGNYTFPKVPIDSFYIKVSFAGYVTLLQQVTIVPAHPSIVVPTFYMMPSTGELDAVVVRTQVQPVKLNGDTTEYKADAFHTKPNANVEDLLKKLPGIDVDADGNIKAQGESVTRIFVNGKRFFGNDPKMATQNLPPDVVEKIQVFDALSDQSAFSGFDDGNRVKTINIVTKKDKNHGYFGKVNAGAGTGKIYNANASINRFNGEQQISFVGQLNNSNQQMFTSQDFLGTSGGNGKGSGNNNGGKGGGGSNGGSGSGSSGNFGGGTDGITKTWAGGLNYRDNWGSKTQAYGSYDLKKNSTRADQVSQRINLYQDSTTNQNSQRISGSRNINHNFHFNIETAVDSLNSFIFRPNLSTQSTDNNNNSVTDIFKPDNDGVSQPISTTISSSNAHNNGYNGSGDLLYRHRFGKKGRTFSVGFNWSGNTNNGYGYNTNNVTYGNNDSVRNTDRYYESRSKGNNYSTTMSYTEPIGLKQQVELNLNHSYNTSTSDRTTYNFDSTTMRYSLQDSLLTNHYENEYQSERGTLSYHYNDGKLNFSAGGGVQFGKRHSLNLSKNLDLSQSFTNFYPTANLRYNFTKTKNLRFNYEGRTTQPSIAQLQPVLDNTNPLYIRDGNPDLKQTFSNSFRFQYFSFNKETNVNMFATVNFSMISNNIVNALTRLDNGGQYTKPVNMNGNYTLSAYYNYGFPIKAIASNLNFSTNISTSRTGSLVDSVTNFTNNYSLGETIKWTTNLEKTWDVNFFATPNYHISKYSVQGRENANYFSQVLDLEVTWYTESGWIWNNKFDYTYYNGLYTTSVPLWNMSFARQLFKNKRGEIKISVHDLLNQNQSVTNSRTDNYIQQTTNSILRRYAMLTFTYNIRSFERKQLPGLFRGRGGNRGGGRNRG